MKVKCSAIHLISALGLRIAVATVPIAVAIAVPTVAVAVTAADVGVATAVDVGVATAVDVDVATSVDVDVADGEVLHIPTGQTLVALRELAMPELGSGRLAKILTRYYQEGLGGAENWEEISSLRISGTLTVRNNEFELKSFQKKPDLIKLTLRADQNTQNTIVLAFDGETAWQDLPGRDKSPMPMAEAEARRFEHSAKFGNHLLHPFAPGKKIEYIDTVPVEGAICHQIRVSLDTGYQTDYFIDIRSYLEVKIHNMDLRNETTNSIVLKDYFREQGMPIARSVESFEDGEWVSKLSIEEVQVNSGVIPWMFDMPPAKEL